MLTLNVVQKELNEIIEIKTLRILKISRSVLLTKFFVLIIDLKSQCFSTEESKSYS